MSPSREQAKPLPAQSGSAGKLTADGRRVYRMIGPQIIWWAWAVLLVLCLGDLLIQGHDFVSLKFAFGALAVTGLVFACTLRPKVIADDDGITVLNPFRRFDIPWEAVNGIFLADSVEVQCARGSEKKDKTVYSWALSAPRRPRIRPQRQARQWEQVGRNRPSGQSRPPSQARELAKMTPAEAIARELAGLSEQARADQVRAAAAYQDGGMGNAQHDGTGADGGALTNTGDGATGTEPAVPVVPQVVMCARWEWLPLAAIFIPAIALALSQFVK